MNWDLTHDHITPDPTTHAEQWKTRALFYWIGISAAYGTKHEGSDGIKHEGSDVIKHEGSDVIKHEGSDVIKHEGSDVIKHEGSDVMWLSMKVLM